jgi:outer membrane biosynthesis protein TonB
MSYFVRCAQVGVSLGLMAVAPLALAQKMYKCTDASGSAVFQQSPCPETAKEAEARAKEKERLEAEAARKKDEEARKKADAVAKAKERDKAYEEQAKERAAATRKAEEAEKKLMQGTTYEGAATSGATAAPAAAGAPKAAAGDDGSLPSGMASVYPGPWKEGNNSIISSAFAKKAIVGCSQYRYRQREGGGAGEFVVQCKPGTKVHYFVWPTTEAVKGPVSF